MLIIVVSGIYWGAKECAGKLPSLRGPKTDHPAFQLKIDLAQLRIIEFDPLGSDP